MPLHLALSHLLFCKLLNQAEVDEKRQQMKATEPLLSVLLKAATDGGCQAVSCCSERGLGGQSAVMTV